MIGKTVVSRGGKKSQLSFMKPVQPDEKLSEITGGSPLPLSEVSRRVWDYIRHHGLQDKERKVLIHADDKLEAIFNGKRCVTIFELFKLVSSHLVT